MTPKGNTLKAGPLNQRVLFFALAGWLHTGAHPTGQLSTRMARDPNPPEEEESTNPHGLQTASSVGSAQPQPAILKAHKRIFKPTTGKNSVPRSSSWEYMALYKRVEGNYTRSMGFGSSTGISDPFQLKPTYWDMLPTFPPATTTTINPDKENRGNASMWGYPGGSKPTGKFYEQRVSSAQKRRGLATNNIKVLNQYVAKQHFKMEDIRTMKDIIRPRDYMAKLDLKDAYFSVPVAADDRKYLRFEWAGRVYEYTCLPFGLTSAPWIFTKLFRPVLAYLLQRGVRCLMYLDDKLLLGNSPEEVKEHFNLCQKLITSLGFTINWKKTVQEPMQTIEFLGFIINSIEMTLSVSLDKLNNSITEYKRLFSNPLTTLRNLCHVIGLMMSVH